jgi:hypothetical protein
MNPVQHPIGLVLGETSQDEASEFPVVSSMQRPVLLRLAEVPILLCSLTDQARDLKRGGPGQGLPFKSTGGDSSGAGLCAAVRVTISGRVDLTEEEMAIIREQSKIVLNGVANEYGYDNWNELKNERIRKVNELIKKGGT